MQVPNTPLRIEKRPARKGNGISISAEGVCPLSYEWFLGKKQLCNNQDYDGCSTDGLVILNENFLLQGAYKCKVKDKFGNCVESEELGKHCLFVRVCMHGNYSCLKQISLKRSSEKGICKKKRSSN